MALYNLTYELRSSIFEILIWPHIVKICNLLIPIGTIFHGGSDFDTRLVDFRPKIRNWQQQICKSCYVNLFLGLKQ